MAEFVSGLHAREPLGFGHSSEPAATVSDARADERGEEPMAVFNGAFPILPGKEQESRAFAATCMGQRRKEFEEQLSSDGISRETWALQETPMGSFMLVWFEAPDIAEVFTNLASLNTEFTTWFRAQVKDLTGVDLGAPPEGPPPDVLVDCAP
jgi:hypothetical protein